MDELSDGAPSTRQTLASVLLGAFGIIVLGLQPLLYSAYVAERLITESQLGLLGAIEVAAIAIGSGIAVPLMSRVAVRRLSLMGIIVLIACNMIQVSGAGLGTLMAVRAGAGLGGGILVGIMSVVIARTVNVGRWAACFQLVQASVQVLVIQWFSIMVPQASGWQVQQGLALIAAVCVLFIPLMPLNLLPPTHEGAERRPKRPTGAGLAGLIGMFLYIGGLLGIWVYAGLWLADRGVGPTVIGHVLSFALAGQACAALCSMLIRDGRGAWLRLAVSMGALIGIVLLWLANPASLVIAALFGIAWQISAPAFSSALVEMDPERRAIPYAAAAQLAGIAVIPAVVGLTMSGVGMDGEIISSLVFIVLAWIVILALGKSVLRNRADRAYA